jgi:hypothetical protein
MMFNVEKTIRSKKAIGAVLEKASADGEGSDLSLSLSRRREDFYSTE